MRYVLPTALNVCFYTTLAKMNFPISKCLTTDRLLVLFPQSFFFALKPNFYVSAQIHQKRMLKIHVAVRHHTYFWDPLRYNKPRNRCNKGSRSHSQRKIRKLKKSNARHTNKPWQLIQDSQSKCSNCPPRAFTQECNVEIENKKVLWK